MLYTFFKLVLIICLIAILVVVLFVALTVGGVISVFNSAKKVQDGNTRTYAKDQAYGQGGTTYKATGGQAKKKIIPDDEGEYVDFEEVD